MATVPPPPSKRQKTAAAALAREQADVETPIPEGAIRVRFVDQATGETGSLPVISVPLSQATTKNLELLLNELQERGDDRLPYRFFYTPGGPPWDGGGEALGDRQDLYNALVKPGKVSAESEITLQYAPQAVFRVKAVSRCAAAISGHGEAILAVQFSPANSSRMATGSGDNTARVGTVLINH
jgi:ribosome assembly protein 4